MTQLQKHLEVYIENNINHLEHNYSVDRYHIREKLK